VTSRLRDLRLAEARAAVVRTARFRAPQRDAFRAFYDLIEDLDDDLAELDQERIKEQLVERGLDIPGLTPYLVFALATGVGKTRLMGAMIAWLYLSGQTRNVLVLAPRTAVLEKFERESLAGAAKYLLLDPALVPEPHLCLRTTIADFEPDPGQLNLFLLSPQSLTGGDRRIGRPREFRGLSLLQYLRDVDDLVVVTDEAHHLSGTTEDGPSAWSRAVEDLAPRLHLGFTATPRVAPGVNTVYSYDLGQCLKEKLYTKEVKLWVKTNDHGMSDVDWDRMTLDWSLQRLAAKRRALYEYVEDHDDFAFVEPVLLVAAKDTEHAEEVATWLRTSRGLSEAELLVTHSERKLTETDLTRLVAIDRPGNTIKVVVNVYRLMEGWDVTNVFVIAPLRATATWTAALQALGRGLRLPAGRRVGDTEVDRLDLVCFGRETLRELVDSAMKDLGGLSDGGPGLTAADADDADNGEEERHPFVLVARPGLTMSVPDVEREDPDVDLSFAVRIGREVIRDLVTGVDLGSFQFADAAGEGLTYAVDDLVRLATQRVLSDLVYLDVVTDAGAVRALVRQLLDGINPDGQERLAVDPVRIALVLGDQIDRRRKQQRRVYRALPTRRPIAIGDATVRVPLSVTASVQRSTMGIWE
jgi:hypothetical protein